MNLASTLSLLLLSSAALLAIGTTLPGQAESLAALSDETHESPQTSVAPNASSRSAMEPVSDFDYHRINARAITVEISSPSVWGTGVIIEKELQGSQFRYLVLTNAHVLQSSTTVNLKTNDNQIHEGQAVPLRNVAGHDLALIQFTSPQTYLVATFAPLGSVQPWEPVYVAGFPLEHESQNRPAFDLVQGEVILIPEHTLEAGYQIGYHSKTAKGMSGGPVLNEKNEVVAIHGLGAFPFWGNPYTYQDGSPPPCEPLWQVMYRLSWGIPGQIIEEVVPQVLTIAPPDFEPPLKLAQTYPVSLTLDTPLISFAPNYDRGSWPPSVGMSNDSSTSFVSPQNDALSLEDLETRALINLAKACLPLSSSFRPN